jgi:hypothetical protein
MTLAAAELEELSRSIADRLYVQVAGWHLYLGDAGLAQTLAIECAARLDQGAEVCARQALEAVQVPIGGGATRLPLARLVPAGQLRDLEDVLQDVFIAVYKSMRRFEGKSAFTTWLYRLTVHVGETRRSLAAGGACGRRLDFLMQEFNREANTLSSKSVAAETTQAAVDMKVLIEQMREQVQNIE